MPNSQLATLKLKEPLPRSARGPVLADESDPEILNFAPPLNLRTSLEGYSFLECLDRSLLGEVWKVLSPEGNPYLAHFLPIENREEAEEKISRLQKVCHRGLAPFRFFPGLPNQLILLTEFHGITLVDQFQRYQKQGWAGIPAEELLHYLRMAAVTLDSLYHRHRMQHLRLQPRLVLLQNQRVLLTGFGLVEMLWLTQNLPVPELNPRYSAPELYHRRRTGQCDQYSFAMIYVELRTGVYPLHRPHLSRPDQRTAEEYDLSLLSEAERHILERALARNPYQRFANSTDLITALEAAHRRTGWLHVSHPEPMGPVLVQSPLLVSTNFEIPPHRSLEEFVHEILERAVPQNKGHKTRWEHILPLQEETMEIPDLVEFCKEWEARPIAGDGQHRIFHLPLGISWWRRLLGEEAGLILELKRIPTRPSEFHLILEPFGGTLKQQERLLADQGPRILQSLRYYLNAREDLRQASRLVWKEKLRICPVIDEFQLGSPIECFAKDISPSGIGFFLQEPLNTRKVYISLPGDHDIAHFAGLVKVVRKKPRGSGWFEIGAEFPRETNEPEQ